MPWRCRTTFGLDATLNGKDTDANFLHDYYHEDMGNLENVEQENHTNLATLTQELDDYATESRLEKAYPWKPYIK